MCPAPGLGSAVTAVLVLPQSLLGRRETPIDDPSLTLTRYFLTGQGPPHLWVPSHIMPTGGRPTWRWKTYSSWTRRRPFERSFRPCSNQKPRTTRLRPTASSRTPLTNARPPTLPYPPYSS